MTPSERFRQILEQTILPKVKEAVDYTATDVSARIEDNISRPVEYVGDTVIRSQPGEPPRMETGKLRAGLHHQTEIDGLTVRATISDKRKPTPATPEDVAVRLELGIGVAPRPFMKPGMEIMKKQIGQNIASESA